MSTHHLAIVLVAIGTYLARFLPMRFNEKFKSKWLDEFLTYSSVALISALFVTSLVSFPVKPIDLSVSIAALIFVFISYKKWRNLGLSVLVGIVVHLIFSLSMRLYPL